jgi:hypothetical protein
VEEVQFIAIPLVTILALTTKDKLWHNHNQY